MIIQPFFLQTGRILVNNDLRIRKTGFYLVFKNIRQFMRLIKRQIAIQFQVKFKHINAAEISSPQVVDTAAKTAIIYQFKNSLPHFLGQLLIHQERDGLAGNLIGIEQKICGNK